MKDNYTKEEDNYYNIDRISISRLNAWKNGEGKKAPESVLKFGRDFHQALLEPHLYQGDDPKINDMVKAVQNTSYFKDLFANLNAEREKEFFFEYRGAKCKSKIDFICNDIIFDFKTTSVSSPKAFLKSIDTYNYGLQAYFYMIATGLKTFGIIGVQKYKPHKIYMVQFELDLINQSIKDEVDSMIDQYLIENPQYKI
jgi:hypothetical protein